MAADSVILLDAMSSGEEETLEDNDAEEKERTERLMSMAEYRDEIYEYLRQSEVCQCSCIGYILPFLPITTVSMIFSKITDQKWPVGGATTLGGGTSFGLNLITVLMFNMFGCCVIVKRTRSVN